MKKVFYVYRTARNEILKKTLRMEEPDHTLYGLNYLMKWGLKADFSDRAYSKWNFLYWIFYPLQKLLIKHFSTGFKIDQAILLLPKLKKCRIIVTTTDSAGLPILLFKKLKLINSKIIYISTGFINELYKKRYSLLASSYTRILTEADIIITHSGIEKELFIKVKPDFLDKVRFIPFGVDRSFFKKKVARYPGLIIKQRESKGFILSVGRDKSRDFVLLKKVASLFPQEKFIVVTSARNVSGIKFPSNVLCLYDLAYKQVKQLYFKSKLIFIPLKELNKASGQVNFLESYYAGKKIVVTNVKGIYDVYSKLVSHPNVYFYKNNSVSSAKKEISKALNNPVSEELFIREYSSAYYSKKIFLHVKRLLAQ